MVDEKTTVDAATTEQLFWAKELVQLARSEAKKRGVPDHAMAQALLVQAWMLFTGEDEEAARKSVGGLYRSSISQRVEP